VVNLPGVVVNIPGPNDPKYADACQKHMLVNLPGVVVNIPGQNDPKYADARQKHMPLEENGKNEPGLP
jgi:hypothetical protein